MAAETIPCITCGGEGSQEVSEVNMAKDADGPIWHTFQCERCDGDGEVSADWNDDQAEYVDDLEARIARLTKKLREAGIEP